jgi:hypothetical protein
MKKPPMLIQACFLFATGILFFHSGYIAAQTNGIHVLQITATSRGNTTGDIAKLSIFNPTDKNVNISIGPYFIPGNGKFQSYLVPAARQLTVPANETILLNLRGYCTDIYKPPATEKEPFTPVREWISIDEQPAGTSTPVLPASLHPDAHPAQAAPYLLQAIRNIEFAYEKLKREGKIRTSLSGNPEKEREAVIQQTFWMYMADARRLPYTKEQFSLRMYEQYEEKSGVKPLIFSPAQKEDFSKGVDLFWESFQTVGTEAKIFSPPEPEKELPFKKPVSMPQTSACHCSLCEVVQKLRITDVTTKQDIKTDSVPWMANRLRLEPPLIKCNCPEKCDPHIAVQLRYTPYYKYSSHSASLWLTGPLELNVWDPGYMDFEAEYTCTCAGKPCGNGRDFRRIHFTERNNCCDSIRKQNNGLVRFGFRGGYAQMDDHLFWLESKDCGYQKFEFGFNLEALFCNLRDDEVFSHLTRLLQAEMKSGKIGQVYSSSDVSMAGVSSDPAISKYYGFGFSKITNAKEVAVFISIDKEKCVYDISLFCNGKLYEFAAPPYVSPEQLTAMANSMGSPAANQSWMRMMMILSQLARAREYKQEEVYRQAMRNSMAKILNQATILSSQTEYQHLGAAIASVKALAAQCVQTGDFGLLDKIMDAIIPFLNATK